MPGPDLSRQSTTGPSPSKERRTSKHSNGSIRQSGTYNPRASQRVHGSKMGGSRMSMARGSRMTGRGTDGALPNDHRVFDEEGRDRTPKPMLSMRPAVLRQYPSLMGESMASSEAGDASSSRGLERLSSAGFSRAGFSTGSMTPEIYDDTDSVTGPSPRTSETGTQGPGLKKDADGSSKAKSMEQEPEVVLPEMLTAADLERSVCVTLRETETMWLLDLPGTTVNMDSEEARAVEQANQRYKELLKVKESSDRYIEAEAQTLNPLLKTKEAQSATTSRAPAEAQATTWDIHDTFHGSADASAEAADDGAALAGLGHAIAAGAVAQEDGRGGGSVMSMQGAPISRMQSIDAGSARASSTGSTGTSAFGSQMMLGTGERGSFSERTSMTQSSAPPSLISGMPSQMAGIPGIQRSSQEEVVTVDPLAKLTGLLDALKLMDAAVMQNAFHDKLLLYRNVCSLPQEVPDQPTEAPTEEASEAQLSELASSSDTPAPVSRFDSGLDPDALDAAEVQRPNFGDEADAAASAAGPVPRMELLWDWQCELTTGLNAACMAWNKVRTDILAVGYGQHEFGPQRKGQVAFWSLKNPGYPLWTFATATGVTAVDFSTHNPNMLAVGLYDGTLAVYDVKSRQGVPAMASSAGAGKHSDPVWKLKWVDRGLEHEEVLVSISTDGRVTQWSITKGLEHTDLMKLKRVVSRAKAPAPSSVAARNIKSEAFISRRSSGMSFDFSGRDMRMYIAGTEDGHIHKCSTSYAEQYLESYSGHMGPVYQVQWSPFQADLFLSASADWTVRLWAEGKAAALLTFQSGNSEVNDVQWCPSSSTVFGDVTGGGRLQIWDIACSTVKPIAQHELEGVKQLCMLFASSSPIVVAGCSDGAVRVYRLFDMAGMDDAPAMQSKRLDDAMRANIVKADPTQTPAEGQ
ncbi:hypothetical protein WJX72_007628 [[Myrmecia] bisecta]|uniref:Dynein axonemal intermediate chain 4 n=1 Tax=[Myrmecia] bisecta TaxID=41462 RepID=A0AAW1R7G5_9CHLO